MLSVLAKVAVLQFFEHFPSLIGFKHFGMTGRAAFCPEDEGTSFG